MTPQQANKALQDALETWEQWWPHLNCCLSPYERYMVRHIDAGLRYVAELT